jgi:hypothetical protein
MSFLQLQRFPQANTTDDGGEFFNLNFIKLIIINKDVESG